MFTRYEFLGKYLSPQIRELLKPFYARLKAVGKIKIDKKLLSDLVEFHNESRDFKITYREGIELCKLGKKLMADLWNVMDPQTDEQVRKFYEVCPYTLFELIYAHANQGNRKFRQKIVEIASGNVLDYGGGDGSLSMKITNNGTQVTYVDVKSMTKDFAKWVFNKRGYNIEVLDACKNQEQIWQKEYDTIICTEVIEHIVNPKPLLQKVTANIRKNGKLIISRLNCPGPTDDLPLHFKLSFDAEKLLKSSGLVREEGVFDGDRDLFVKRS